VRRVSSDLVESSRGWSGRIHLSGEANQRGRRYSRSVVDDVAASVGAFRWVLPVVAGLAAVAAVLTDPGSAIENVVAIGAVTPFVVWAWWPGRLSALALIPVIGAAELFAQRSVALEPLMFLVCIAAAVFAITERSLIAAAIATIPLFAIPYLVARTFDDEILYGVWMMGIVLSFVLGRGFRRQVELASQLSAARDLLARQAVLDEKRRVARDVHDLVGHGLAAVLLHVTGARHLLRRDVDEADHALADAETVGRRSLDEVRRTLTLLRGPDAEGTALPPLPGAGDIAEAVQAARAAGVDAGFTLEGDPRHVDPVVGLSLHRVAEEALANARRHAPRAVTDVVLSIEDATVRLSVETIGPLDADADANTPTDADRPRYGLVGMRERMAAVGGDFEAGPTPTGWAVHCRAPLAPSPSPAT
jgi:signal transduction histidine kinase